MSGLAGTGTLLRFQLRRDRLRLPLWVLGIPVFSLYFSVAITALTHGGDDLGTFAPILANPVTSLVGGPGYGYGDLTVARMIAGLYAVYLMLAAALMGATTVIRHTRVDEQSGRAGLLRAGAVGRHAPLAASLLLATAMSLAVAVLCAAGLSVVLGTPGSAALLGCSIGAVGVAFAGAGAVAAQVTTWSRTATALVGVILGLSFIVRGLGDMSRTMGGAWSFLSWVSPLGWAQQTAPYTLDRWWPLLFCLVAGVVCVAAGVLVEGRRDLGAGLWPDRPGPDRAPVWLGSAPALAWRLQRGNLLGWAVAMLVAGVMFGSFAESVGGGAEGLPEAFTDLLGGRDGLVDGYLGFMGLYFGIIVAVYAVLSVRELAADEERTHTAAVLATGVGRTRWLLSWTGVTAVGVPVLLAVAGVGEGVGAAVVTGDTGVLVDCVLGHVLLTPAVWFLAAVGVALYGVAPGWSGAAWVVFGVSTVVAVFGPMMRAGDAVLWFSPFTHVGRVPGGDADLAGVGVLLLVTVVLTGVGVLGFRRRDLRAR